MDMQAHNDITAMQTQIKALIINLDDLAKRVIKLEQPLHEELKAPECKENMPKHGVLCWVSDVNESPNSDHPVDIITSSALKTNYGAYWRYATPLTNKEIEAFKR